MANNDYMNSFNEKRNLAENKIREALNDLSIEFEVSLDIEISMVDVTSTADTPKRYVPSVKITGVM